MSRKKEEEEEEKWTFYHPGRRETQKSRNGKRERGEKKKTQIGEGGRKWEKQGKSEIVNKKKGFTDEGNGWMKKYRWW